MPDLTLSDWLLVMSLVPASLFLLGYGALAPWYRSAFGWVIFLYALATVALLSLIVYGVVFGARVPEEVRVIVAGAVVCASTAKVVIFVTEQRIGRSRRIQRKDRTA